MSEKLKRYDLECERCDQSSWGFRRTEITGDTGFCLASDVATLEAEIAALLKSLDVAMRALAQYRKTDTLIDHTGTLRGDYESVNEEGHFERMGEATLLIELVKDVDADPLCAATLARIRKETT